MTAATDGAYLLAAILKGPADDLARLAYADALEEGGEARRAEFVRACLAFHAGGGPESLARLRATGDAWRLMLPPGPRECASLWQSRQAANKLPFAALGVRFRKGFVQAVRCPLAAWQAHGPALVRAHPVERAELTDRDPLFLEGRNDRPDGFCWRIDDGGWVRGDPAEDACLLPERLFARMRDDDNRQLTRQYASREAALAALSDAALAWAKLPEEER